mgnify:CR=1 FL=1
MTPADDTFQLALRYIEDAIMVRRSAAHFSDVDFRASREAEADSLSRVAMSLTRCEVASPAGGQR